MIMVDCKNVFKVHVDVQPFNVYIKIIFMNILVTLHFYCYFDNSIIVCRLTYHIKLPGQPVCAQCVTPTSLCTIELISIQIEYFKIIITTNTNATVI